MGVPGVFQKQAESIKKDLDRHGSSKKFSRAVIQEVEAQLFQAILKSKSNNEEKVAILGVTQAAQAYQRLHYKG